MKKAGEFTVKYLTIVAILLLSSQVSAQDVIQLKSGSRVDAIEGSISIDTRNHRIWYKLPNIEKRKKLKFKDVASASFKDHQFQIFNANGKRRGLFILADAKGKRLGATSTRRSVSKGGFEVPYKRYEMAVIDNTGKVVQYMVFTDVNNPNNIAMRKTAGEIVRNNFQDCPNLLERFKTFENSESKVQNGAIAELIDRPYQISCD